MVQERPFFLRGGRTAFSFYRHPCFNPRSRVGSDKRLRRLWADNHTFMNSTLIGAGVIDEPLEFLLFSDFAVVLAYVHLYTLFMVVPIFNSMMRIDRALIEAARDAGAGGAQILWNVVLPLAKPGIAIGSIFVVTLVMGDFITVRFMSGGQSASVGLMMANQISLLQYPAAAANAVILLILVLLIVAAILRVVDIRKEL